MIKVKDIIELIDSDRTGGAIIKVKEQGAENWDTIDTGSMLLDIIADFRLVGISARWGVINIELRSEDYERRMTQR